MTRFALISLAVTIAFGSALAPVALQARSAAPWYRVELAAPATQAQVIAGGVLFTCAGTSCTGPRSTDRALRVCSDLRRETGSVASFTSNGEALAADQLARCNG